MSRRTERVTLNSPGGAAKLPDFLYATSNKYRLLISVMGVQYYLGAWKELDMALCQRDRALHHLRPWMRAPLPELIPLSDLTVLPGNERLDALLSKLRCFGEPSRAEGVAATATEKSGSEQGKTLREAVEEGNRLLNSIDSRLERLVTLLEARA